MNAVDWTIPPSVLRHLERIPADRPVVLLLRHSVRDDLPDNDAGYAMPITDVGRRLAIELGGKLRGRLRTLHASPFLRCLQTAEALREGAGVEQTIVRDPLIGAPGVFVLDGRRAWPNWERLGYEGLMAHIVSRSEALPGMARPDEAARFLVQHMLAIAGQVPGVHVFVTHDFLVTATVARLLGRPFGIQEWPVYLEGAFFWRGVDGLHTAYRDDEGTRSVPLCSLCEDDVVEHARREIAATVGFDSGARFFLAGGAFKTLLSGRPSRDLDLWAPSPSDRGLLVRALQERGARPLPPSPFGEAVEIADRVVEISHKVEPPTLEERLGRFDIALSAVGVEHCPDGSCSAFIHPLARESVLRQAVLLLKPLVSWKYALATLERMRRYAAELGFVSPPEEEAEVWRVFEAQTPEMKEGMMERYRRTARGGYGILEEADRRRR
jgi:broad specificity phosphatase PhoE